MTKFVKNKTHFEKPKVVKNLKTILQCTNFCSICFENTEELLHLDNSLVIADLGEETLTLRNVLEGIFENTQDLIASDYICKPCKSSACSSFAFIYKTKKTALLYAKYLDQLDRETSELSARLPGNEWKAMIVLDDYEKIEVPTMEETIERYFCDKCGKGYSRRSFLIKHIKKHKMDLLVNCPHCNLRPCIHEEYMESYSRQRNFKVKPMACPCGYKFGKTLQSLIAHVNKEHFGIKLECECGKIFYLGNHYKKHLESHDKFLKTLETPSETYAGIAKSLEYSKYHILSENNLLNHMASHTYSKKQIIKRNRIYKCQICHKDLKTKLQLRAHINKHDKKPNMCLYCNKQFNSRDEYLTHTQSEEHKRNIPYGFKHHCSHCDYSANTIDMLEAHINRIHLNVRPFQCEHCPKRYFDSTQLKNHLKTHTGRKTKVCDICGAHLAGPTALKKHRRLHTGEHPYSCPYCDVKTVCASTLKTHIMRKHMEPTISCPLCDLKFHTMNNARGHVRKTHWKSKEKFDYTKLKGLAPSDYDFFRDRRKAVV